VREKIKTIDRRWVGRIAAVVVMLSMAWLSGCDDIASATSGNGGRQMPPGALSDKQPTDITKFVLGTFLD
jgi:hypothetical protein